MKSTNSERENSQIRKKSCEKAMIKNFTKQPTMIDFSKRNEIIFCQLTAESELNFDA